MPRRFLLLLAIAITLATSPAGRAEAEITIGFASPLTGPSAPSGVRNWQSVQLAVTDINAAGGVLGQELKAVVADDVCGVEEAARAALELVEARVSAVVGHMCSHSTLMAAGIYETADVLMISPSSTHPRLTEEGRGNVFRLIGRDDHQGRLAGDFLATYWAEGRIAIVHDGSTYGEGLAAETRKRLRQLGVVEALYEQYSPDADDYAALVDQLEAARIDVVYVGGYGPDAGLILRTARERGLDLQLVGGDAVGADEFWAAAGEAGEGTIFSGRLDVTRRPDAASILTRLGIDPASGRIGGIAPYAAVQVWAQAVERAGTAGLAQVAGTLRRGRFETALGEVAFDVKGDLKGAGWHWKMWTKGQIMGLPADLLQQQARAHESGSLFGPFGTRLRSGCAAGCDGG